MNIPDTIKKYSEKYLTRENIKKYAKMHWKKFVFPAGLAIWYAFTTPLPGQISNKKNYPLPAEIKVVDTSLPYETRQVIHTYPDSSINAGNNEGLEKIVKTATIDFSKNFYIQTDRYKLVKNDDFILSRLIGHLVSINGKILFLDWNYGLGQDKYKTQEVLSMLENDKEIKDITVRLNHNQTLRDMRRMFSDKKLSKRNELLARIIMGIPLSLGNELWGEYSRGSYYNPLTKTAVCYSNIESITAHEIGHHKDFQRFGSDWEYLSARIVPLVMLYQEWRASQNAKSLLSAEDQWQFNRYLLPAFLTYLLASYHIVKGKIKGKMKEVKERRKSEKTKSEKAGDSLLTYSKTFRGIYLEFTQREREIFNCLYSYNGDEAEVAGELGIKKETVQRYQKKFHMCFDEGNSRNIIKHEIRSEFIGRSPNELMDIMEKVGNVLDSC